MVSLSSSQPIPDPFRSPDGKPLKPGTPAAPSSTQGLLSAFATAADPQNPADRRITMRMPTPLMPPVNLMHAGGLSTFTTLRNISSGGICLARRGRLELPPGSQVELEIHWPGNESTRRCRAKVCWCHFAGFNTYIGLSFQGSDRLQLRFLEAVQTASAA